MDAAANAFVVLILLLGSAAAGILVHPLLSERHRSLEMTDFLRLVATMLITFVALVLGLLTTSAKASYDKVGNDLKGFSIAIIQLDRLLREWDGATEPARALLRDYTASAIATTWRDEPRPAGNYHFALPVSSVSPLSESPALGDMLNRIELDIRRLDGQDPIHHRLAADCLAQMQHLMQIRWRLIEESGSSITTPFYMILVFWLIIMFASFGLTAPRNFLSYTAIALGALAIASVVFVILELDTPFSGVIAVSSQSMRDALAHLNH
ncbi:MAG TPA: hypothetical protein VJ770_08530 [Stellaceae bacterium]|nr:hypothetical protein [Stellaceae bacterium]